MRKDDIAHASSFIIENVMICLLLDFDELQDKSSQNV